jgi:mevalonate kinase
MCPPTVPFQYEIQNRSGSGVDIAANVFGRILRYELKAKTSMRPSDVQQIAVPGDLQMRYIGTGRPASTGQFLKNLSHSKNQNRGDYDQTMQKLVRLAQFGCEAFEKRKTKAFL